MTTRDASAWIRWPGYLAWSFLALLPLSVLTVRAGQWQQGLLLFGLAGLLSLLVLALLAMQFLLPGRRAQRPAIGRAALPALPGAVLLIFLAVKGGQAPPIHDITTDVDDPPRFEVAPDLRGPQSNPLAIKPEVLAQQLEAYPDLQTLRLDDSYTDTYNRALGTARARGWTITREDPTAGFIEAVDTSAVMGFKDDVVIRVRTNADGSLVDLRSVSRVGISDLGANARRIRAFITAFREA